MMKRHPFVCGLLLFISQQSLAVISEVTILRSPDKKQHIICCYEFHVDDPKNLIVATQQAELIALAKKLQALLIVEDPYAYTPSGDNIRDGIIQAWIKQQIAMDKVKLGMIIQDESIEEESDEEVAEQGAVKKEEDFFENTVCLSSVRAAAGAGVQAITIDLRALYSASLDSKESLISSDQCIAFFQTWRQAVANYKTSYLAIKTFYQDVAKKITRNEHDRLIYDLLLEVKGKSAAHVIELYDTRDDLKKTFATQEAFDEAVTMYGDRLLDAELVYRVETEKLYPYLILCAGVDHILAAVDVLKQAGYTVVNSFGRQKQLQESISEFVRMAQGILPAVDKSLSIEQGDPKQAPESDKSKRSPRKKRKRSPSPEKNK